MFSEVSCMNDKGSCQCQNYTYIKLEYIISCNVNYTLYMYMI